MALASKPEERGTIHKLKYIIDKSLIPQMQLKMNKIQSESASQLKPKINTLNVDAELQERKSQNSIKESIKFVGERENKLEGDRVLLQHSPILSSPKSVLKVHTPNGTNSHSKFAFNKREVNMPHFQTVTKKKVEITDLKGVASFKHIPGELARNQTSLKRIVSLPLSNREIPGSIRII